MEFEYVIWYSNEHTEVAGKWVVRNDCKREVNATKMFEAQKTAVLAAGPEKIPQGQDRIDVILLAENAKQTQACK